MKIINLIQKEVSSGLGYPATTQTFAVGLDDSGQQVSWKPSKKELQIFCDELETKVFECRCLLEEEEIKEINTERILHDVFDE